MSATNLTNGTSALVVDNVSKTFGGMSVLESISLKIGVGETVALVGSNGAGKTTLYQLRIRQHVGYLAGKRALEQHSGMREASKKEQKDVEEGWQRIATWIIEASKNGVIFLPASKAHN